MKKVIELLERAEGAVMLATAGKPDSSDLELCTEAVNYINEAMALLKTPRWETPEQWEKRTGEPWPDDAPVFTRSRSGNDGWSVSTWGRHKQAVSFVEGMGFSAHDPYVVCATEAGPPPDTWVPEEEGK